MASEEEWTRRYVGNDAKEWAWAMSQIDGNTSMSFATCGEEGPRVRPLTAVPFEGNIYLLTDTDSAKVQQLSRDPRFEFYVELKKGKNTGYVRFAGRASKVEDPKMRHRVGESCGFVEDHWEGLDDPSYTMLHLEIERAEVMRPGETEYILLDRK